MSANADKRPKNYKPKSQEPPGDTVATGVVEALLGSIDVPDSLIEEMGGDDVLLDSLPDWFANDADVAGATVGEVASVTSGDGATT